MRDRAQVILVVTGLGAKSQVSSGAIEMGSKKEKAKSELKQVDAIPEMIEESMESTPVDILSDLDVPAFMRKRARVNAKVGIAN
jgi:hypothetical protein